MQLGETTTTGILECTGATNSTTNRQLLIGKTGNTNAAYTGGAAIRNNGSGSLTFTNAIFNTPAAKLFIAIRASQNP